MPTKEKVPAVENFRDQRHFTLAQILNVIDGHLFSKIDDVYELLDFMTGDSLMTHQLPRASDEVKPYILNRHPQLRDMIVPEVTPANYKKVLSDLEAVYGNDFGLYPIADGEYAPQEPIQEIVNMIEDSRQIG